MFFTKALVGSMEKVTGIIIFSSSFQIVCKVRNRRTLFLLTVQQNIGKHFQEQKLGWREDFDGSSKDIGLHLVSSERLNPVISESTLFLLRTCSCVSKSKALRSMKILYLS